jgi:hypothetical protein
MTVETPKNKRGKVKPPMEAVLKLNIDESFGSWLALMQVQIDLEKAKESKDAQKLLNALRAVAEWFVEYAGVTQEQVMGIPRNQYSQLVRQAETAFGDVPIPQTKS